MHNQQSILTVLHASIAGLFGLVASSHGFFADMFKEYASAVFVAALLVLFYLFRQSEKITEIMIERIPGISPALRRRLMGNRFIEGDWPLVVLGDDRRSLKYLGFLSIGYEHGELTVKGIDWQPDGSHAHNFASQQTRYAKNRLQYWYEQGKDARMRGYTEIYFFPETELPDRHAGEFLDKEHFASRFYARRLALPARSRKKLSEDAKLAAARAVWESVEAKLDRVASRDISADWE